MFHSFMQRYWIPYNAIILLCCMMFAQLVVYESITPLFGFSVLVFTYSMRFNPNLEHSKYELLLGVILYLAFLILHIQSLFLLGFVFVFLYLLQSIKGRLNSLPFFIALLALPVTGTILSLVSFNIRLLTTKYVAKCLKLLVADISYDGNIIYFNHQAYGVDDVCSGIVMLQIGLLIALFLMAYMERKHNMEVRHVEVLGLLILASCSILLSNAFRIVIVVLFQLDEENLWHELIGVVSLAVYFVIPFYFFLEKIAKRFKSSPPAQHRDVPPHRFTAYSVVISTFMLVLMSFYFLQQKKNINQCFPSLSGYQKKDFKYGVVQYSNPDALIYVKPEVPFYAANHHPRLCWKGSGYSFTHEKMVQIDGHQIITALLKNDRDDILFSAYWFQCRQEIVSNDITWRWHSLRNGTSFKMINVTSSTEMQLHKEIEKWLTFSRHLYSQN